MASLCGSDIARTVPVAVATGKGRPDSGMDFRRWALLTNPPFARSRRFMSQRKKDRVTRPRKTKPAPKPIKPDLMPQWLKTDQALAAGERFFRPVDWLAFAITTLIALFGYCLTISPDLTLEDSGELRREAEKELVGDGVLVAAVHVAGVACRLPAAAAATRCVAPRPVDQIVKDELRAREVLGLLGRPVGSEPSETPPRLVVKVATQREADALIASGNGHV